MIGVVDEVAVLAALAEVPDPEIPVVSVVDLGMVRAVDVSGHAVHVEILPTFVGCPALDAIVGSVREALAPLSDAVDVEVSYAEPWTTERITEDGRRKLRESGLAPPMPAAPSLILLGVSASCPYCGSRRTVLENAFGPTQCRAIHYCTDCRQPFEQFKTT